MATVKSPIDWMDLPDWDRYWSEVLADKFWTSVNLDTMSFAWTSLQYLRGLERREGHRVLLAGNGISPEPYGFAHAGCDVTVVEVSAVACRVLHALKGSPGLLGRMFTAYDRVMDPALGIVVQKPSPEKSLELLEEEHRPGGCLSIITADLFTYEPTQPFDAIFSRRAYQGFSLDRREGLARRFFRWLAPGGFAFVEMLNISDREPFEGPFRAAGFREVQDWAPRGSGDERSVFFFHGSG
jgi:hypothetical protein